MKIEILIGEDGPLFYPLNRPKIMTGSADSCDLVIASEGISRKHLQIIIEDDNVYLIDQGSTNGSFVNEERLVPGRRIEFTSFFPVRMGHNVLMTLISDDEIGDGALSDFNVPSKDTSSPSLINTNSLDIGRTIKLDTKKERPHIKKGDKINRSSVSNKRTGRGSSQEIQDRFRMITVTVVSFLAIAVAIFMNFDDSADLAVIPEVPVSATPSTTPPVVIPEVSNLIDQEYLTKKESFERLIGDFKCLSELEKHLCENIRGAGLKKWGVTQVGTMLNVMIDATEIIDEANVLIPIPKRKNQNVQVLHHENLNLAIMGLTILRLVPVTMDYKKLGDYNLSFALYSVKDGQKNLEKVVAVKSEVLQELRSKVEDTMVKNAQNFRVTDLEYLKKSVTIY